MTEIGTKVQTDWNLENTYADLPDIFFSKTKPTPVPSPKLIILNDPLATSLGLNTTMMHSENGIAVLAGNRVPDEATPIAQAYAGHQFGHFTMLGDGRAVLIGEQVTPQRKRVDIQLKGSGRTPYSRGGDGRAALGPMLREYIISEAMHALGIPTTRSLAVVTTGEQVIRETVQPGAVLTRVASSHLRVGTFQYAAQWGDTADIKELADYALERHFPDYKNADNPYIYLLHEVIDGQAKLIAMWQMVGFIHGVMNTDNMTISGETIDYGPCAFMDNYDPATVFSSIDTRGRYAYGNQPPIAAWNLARFAETLLPLLHNNEDEAVKIAQDAIEQFSILHHSYWMAGMRAKLGIFNQEAEDEALVEELLSIMHKYGSDFTNTFRSLSLNEAEGTVLSGIPEFIHWHDKWQARVSRQEESSEASQELMKNSNPVVIPRNHQVEAALEAAVKHGDTSVMEKLLDVLAKPYEYTPEKDDYTRPPEPTACRYRTFCGT